MQSKTKAVQPGAASAAELPMTITDAGVDAAGNGAGSRDRMVAEAAYFLAERRGFAPGYDVSDWLSAEAAIAGTPALAQQAPA